ncbi:hypothetical protein F4781DRAFT_393642 [Annulohypoxylon bovei var. microspora]|nr:hypothetical protein F4781DRAFT_393642 [Annulohypoxylon bovei var. microspora]
MESIEFLRISDEAPSLPTLPTDILYIIITYLDTARSVARLAATCKGLHHFVSEKGWRIFVTQRFNTFTLSNTSSVDEWKARAQSLTSQSRDWDRRGLVVDSLAPLVKPRRRSGFLMQSIPSNIIVDAHHRHQGNVAQDLIFWGAGEDIFGLLRHQKGPKAPTDEYLSSKGELSGYHPGKDDVTCVSILRDNKYNDGQGDGPQVLVGRANGLLDLLSMGADDFGKTLVSFGDLNLVDNESIMKTEIQSLDVNYKQGLLAVATKQGILNYSLDKYRQIIHNPVDKNGSEAEESHYAHADDDFRLKGNRRVGTFDFIRSVKFVNDDTLAVGLNKGPNPLQYLKYTPTRIEISHTPKTSVQNTDYDGDRLKTVRAILPLDTSSLASGSGNAVLTSWDDGTIRLQDLRTPSPINTIFQDNFEVTIPSNALLSRGLERFIAGSAHSSTLKIFDYRWPKGYYHTESLPCGNNVPFPAPRPPSIMAQPYFPDDRATCDHAAGLRCRWHTLSRLDFYRPNFNMWLPMFRGRDNSPVYSLASPSDDSPTIYAGLSGILAEITPKSSPMPAARPCTWPTKDSVYKRYRERVAIIETGSGYVVNDVADIQRMPVAHQQTFGNKRHLDLAYPDNPVWRKQHRLDEWFH